MEIPKLRSPLSALKKFNQTIKIGESRCLNVTFACHNGYCRPVAQCLCKGQHIQLTC